MNLSFTPVPPDTVAEVRAQAHYAAQSLATLVNSGSTDTDALIEALARVSTTATQLVAVLVNG